MKRLIPMFLVLIFLIASCGSSGNQTSSGETNSGETKIVAETEPNTDETSAESQAAEIEIELNKTVESEPIAFTLTEIGDYEQNYNMNDDSHLDGVEKDNYSFILIYYEVKNTGKTTFNSIPARLSILYDGEYVFDPVDVWYYHPDVYSSYFKTKGVWVNSPHELGAFDPEAKCATVFQLPDEVQSSAKPLQLMISLPNDTNIYVYTIR